MTKEEKNQFVGELQEKLSSANVFYLTDTAELTVENVNKLRGLCFRNSVSLQVVKNTLLKKAMENIEGKNYGELKDILKGPTSLMISESPNAPAKLIKEFRKKNEKPILKGAYIDEAIFVGDNQLDALATLKTKEELIGDIITLLQSPAKNVVSALQSGGGKLSGILKTLSERESN